MYKIVIIDDEVLIRDGLVRYLNWESYNIKVCGTAEDGQSGIELCNRVVPDIVITDIRMPAKDGIQLITELKSHLKSTKFIILSGYGEFELAQKALKAGAFDYILKPLNKTQLISAIERVIEEINREQKENNKLSIYSDIVKRNAEQLKSTIISQILNRDYSYNTSDLQYFNILMPFYQFLVYEFESDMVTVLDGSIQHFINQNNLDWHLATHNNNKVILCCFSEHKQNEPPEYLKNLCEYLESTHQIKVYFGVGEIASGIEQAPDSYISALHNLSSMFYCNTQNIFRVGDQYNDVKAVEELFKRETEQHLIHAIENGDKNKMEEIFLATINNIQINGKYKPDELKSCFKALISGITNHISLEHFKQEECLVEISKKNTFKSLITYVYNALSNMCNEFGKAEDGDSKKLIKDIKLYIQNNISNQISLNSISEYFHLNLFYVSHLFKKETNMNFIDYVTGLRIEKAKELLTNQQLKIYEIALSVGYEDQRYFSQIFKKYTGYTPVEFKNKRG